MRTKIFNFTKCKAYSRAIAECIYVPQFVCCGSTPTFSVLYLAKSLCTRQVVDSNFVPEFVIFKERGAVRVRPCRTLLVCYVKTDCVSLLLSPSTAVTSVIGH
jgi:hypothetical protein